MTVLAAMHDTAMGCTWIGSDTHATMGGLKFQCQPKWVIGSHWAVGCAGDARFQNIVRARLMDDLDERNDAFTVTDRLRSALKDDGWNTGGDPGAPDFGVWAMLASPKGVWTICTAFSVDPIKGYWADGSGGQVATGAMYAASLSGLSAEDIIRTGIMAAIEHERGCGGEVWFDRLPEYGVRIAAE